LAKAFESNQPDNRQLVPVVCWPAGAGSYLKPRIAFIREHIVFNQLALMSESLSPNKFLLVSVNIVEMDLWVNFQQAPSKL
jgi:hypothetical protein